MPWRSRSLYAPGALALVALLSTTGCQKEDLDDESEAYPTVLTTTDLTTDLLGTELIPAEFDSEPAAARPHGPGEEGTAPMATKGFNKPVPLPGSSDRPARPEQ